VVRQIQRDDAAVLVDDTIKKSLTPMKARWSVITMTTPRAAASKGSICSTLSIIVTTPTGETMSIRSRMKLWTKPEVYQDPKTGKYKRAVRSARMNWSATVEDFEPD